MSRPSTRHVRQATAPRPRSGPSRPRAGGLWLAAVLVATLVAAVHWPVLSSQALCLDDDLFVVDNPLVTQPGWNSTARFFGEVLAPSTVGGYYLPLTMTSLMVDWAAGGRPRNLGAFHRTHLVLHVASTLLLLLVLWQLFGSVIAAAGAALLFGLHPLTVEPLAWVSERKTLLATCFALASIAAYVRHARSGGRGWFAGSLAAFVLALLAKPTIVSLPLVLVALDAWPLRRLDRRAVLAKWPYFALAALAVGIAIVSQVRTAPLTPIAHTGVLRPMLQIAWMLAFYAGKVLWPVNLTFEYVPPEPYALADPRIAGSVVLVAAIGLAAWVLRRRLPSLLAGVVVFVAALSPTFSIVKWSYFIVYDRYLYFPALGLALAVAGVIAAAARGRSGAGLAPVLVPLLLVATMCAGGTRVAYGHWRDSVALWSQAVKFAPGERDAHNGLANAFQTAGQDDSAAVHYRAALAIDPGYVFALINLGELQASLGRTDEAVDLLRRAMQGAPRDPRAAYALGVAEKSAGRLDRAEAAFRHALEVRPEHVASLGQLGTVLAQRGRPDEGIALIRRALALAPNDPHPHFSLAVLLMAQGSTAEAAEHLRTAVRLRPDWVLPANALAWWLATAPDPTRRDPAEALRLSTVAVERTFRRDPNSLDTRAAALAANGRFAEAAATADEALALAEGGGDPALAGAIRARLALYREGRAFVEVSGTPPGTAARE